MNARTFRPAALSLILGGLALSLAAASVVAANRADNLVENSPFLPEGFKSNRRATPPPQPPPPQGQQPLDRLEFRGMANLGGNLSFSLYDPAQKQSFWIGLGQTDGGFSVTEYKENEDAVVVRHEGKSRTLSLHESKIADLPPEAATPRQERPRATAPAAQQPEDAQSRMQNLAEEIRRRRELRRARVDEAANTEQQQQEGGGRDGPPGLRPPAAPDF